MNMYMNIIFFHDFSFYFMCEHEMRWNETMVLPRMSVILICEWLAVRKLSIYMPWIMLGWHIKPSVWIINVWGRCDKFSCRLVFCKVSVTRWLSLNYVYMPYWLFHFLAYKCLADGSSHVVHSMLQGYNSSRFGFRIRCAVNIALYCIK